MHPKSLRKWLKHENTSLCRGLSLFKMFAGRGNVAWSTAFHTSPLIFFTASTAKFACASACFWADRRPAIFRVPLFHSISNLYMQLFYAILKPRLCC